MKKQKIMLHLLQHNGDDKPKNREKLESRRNELTREIKKLQNNFEKINILELERQQVSPDSQGECLEEYVDQKLEGINEIFFSIYNLLV